MVPPIPSASVNGYDRGEAGRLAKAADRIASVLPCGINHGFPSDVADVLLYRVRHSELQSSGAGRSFRTDPPLSLLLGRPLHEIAQLVVEVLVHTIATKERNEPGAGAREQGHHDSPSDARRILAIAFACTSQSRVSRSSFRRPAVESE